MNFVLSLLALIFSASSMLEAKQDCTLMPQIMEENCCDIPNIIDFNFTASCEEEAEEKGLKGATKTCYKTQCYFKTKNLMDGEKVSVSKMKDHISTLNLSINENWKDLFIAAVPKCVEAAYDKEDKLKTHFGDAYEIDRSVCSPIYDYIAVCIAVEIFQQCPINAWLNTANCRNLKAFVAECPDFLLTARMK